MIVSQKTYFRCALAIFVFVLGLAGIPGAQAQDNLPPPAVTSVLVDQDSKSPMDIVRSKPAAGGTMHPAIRLTSDKSEIIHVNEPIRSLVVGNPDHLNVLMDSARTLVLVPREPGATHFTALGDDGRIIMQRHVIVGSPREQYVRIRRSCANAGRGRCEMTSIYYCPDMCHPVGIMGAERGQPGAAAAADDSRATED